jgi:hypothetical protein
VRTLGHFHEFSHHYYYCYVPLFVIPKSKKDSREGKDLLREARKTGSAARFQARTRALRMYYMSVSRPFGYSQNSSAEKSSGTGDKF